VKFFEWNEEKNAKLKKERGISFDQVASKINDKKELGVIKNPSKNFPDQKVYVVEINEYIYYVPFVENEGRIFLKTIIPSRKATKKYLQRI